MDKCLKSTGIPHLPDSINILLLKELMSFKEQAARQNLPLEGADMTPSVQHTSTEGFTVSEALYHPVPMAACEASGMTSIIISASYTRKLSLRERN